MWGCLCNLLAVEKHVLGRAWGAPGDRAPCASQFCSECAGILQVKIRQRVSGVHILAPVFCEGSMGLLCRDTW
jgi:hypothetical protein